MAEDKKSMIKKLIIKLLYSDLTESEGDELYLRIKELASNPECLDYIYHSNEYYNKNGELDIDSVVDRCLEYEPIVI